MVLFALWILIYPEIYGREPAISHNGLEFLLTMKEIVGMFFKVLL